MATRVAIYARVSTDDMGKVLGRPKFRNGDRDKLRRALDTGESWHAVSVTTKIPCSTVKKHARALGYEPRQRLGKPKAAAGGQIKTNFSGLPTLYDVLTQLPARQNDGPKT